MYKRAPIGLKYLTESQAKPPGQHDASNSAGRRAHDDGEGTHTFGVHNLSRQEQRQP